VKFFNRKKHGIKNWHARAMMIDPKKTHLIIVGNQRVKHVPPWVLEKFATQQPDEE
jgi:hypothetical protein